MYTKTAHYFAVVLFLLVHLSFPNYSPRMIDNNSLEVHTEDH